LGADNVVHDETWWVIQMDVQLGYISIGVSDVAAWQRFADEFLAVTPSLTSEGDLLLRMDDHSFRYVLRPSGEDDLRELGWEVANRNELDAVRERLIARGVKFESKEFDAEHELGAIDHIVFDDPDGLRSVVYTAPHLPKAPVSLPKGHQGFVTGEQGTGHMVLAANSMLDTVDFYMDVLNFRISDYISHDRSVGGLPVTFLHCNPRHHTLAFSQSKPAKRLNHIMFQCVSFDDVGIALDVAKEQKLEFVQELGKHSNDWMTSFYIVTPSGFEVEYGWGGRTIDDATWNVVTYDHISKWGHQRKPRSKAQK
jgi:2,3-dihydroxybiphenyl 1,2-dioxygenase